MDNNIADLCCNVNPTNILTDSTGSLCYSRATVGVLHPEKLPKHNFIEENKNKADEVIGQ